MASVKRIIVRMWNKDGYHKDVAVMNADQVLMSCFGMEPKSKYMVPPSNAVKVVVNPSHFPEAVEFEVIVEVT